MKNSGRKIRKWSIFAFLKFHSKILANKKPMLIFEEIPITYELTHPCLIGKPNICKPTRNKVFSVNTQLSALKSVRSSVVSNYLYFVREKASLPTSFEKRSIHLVLRTRFVLNNHRHHGSVHVLPLYVCERRHGKRVG